VERRRSTRQDQVSKRRDDERDRFDLEAIMLEASPPNRSASIGRAAFATICPDHCPAPKLSALRSIEAVMTQPVRQKIGDFLKVQIRHRKMGVPKPISIPDRFHQKRVYSEYASLLTFTTEPPLAQPKHSVGRRHALAFNSNHPAEAGHSRFTI
jgi:hypothetical protein